MEFFQHFVQAEPFAFVHGLIESFPVKDPHRKDRFRSESALCGSPQRAVEELDLIARRPFFLWHDPLGDPPQVFEAPQTARTTWNEQLVSVRLPPTEVQGKPDPDPCAIHNQMFRPDLIADPSLLNQISEFFHELLGAFHRFQRSPPKNHCPRSRKFVARWRFMPGLCSASVAATILRSARGDTVTRAALEADLAIQRISGLNDPRAHPHEPSARPHQHCDPRLHAPYLARPHDFPA
jgi:hypothetical protein